MFSSFQNLGARTIHVVMTARITAIPNVIPVAVITPHTTHNLLHHLLLPRNPDPQGPTALSGPLDLRDRMDQREYPVLPDYRGHRDFLDRLAAQRDHPVCALRIVLSMDAKIIRERFSRISFFKKDFFGLVAKQS